MRPPSRSWDLIAELSPKGVLEEDIVAEMAHLVWRKQNLVTLARAERARHRGGRIRTQRAVDALVERTEAGLPSPPTHSFELSPSEREARAQATEELVRQELGADYELAKIESATVDGLLRDLAVQDRLDAMIDKCLKRLLFVRGLKSLPAASAPPQPAQQPPALPGPKQGGVTASFD
jgi:hypothetical protein